MGLFNKVTLRPSHKGLSNELSALTNAKPSMRQRSATKIAGAFLFVGVLATAGVSLHASEAHAASNDSTPDKSAKSQPVSTHVQINTSGSSTPAASQSVSNNEVSSNGSSSSSTTVTSSTSNDSSSAGSGSAGTQVTVNGQPVSVPANGSLTIPTTGGQTTISHSQGPNTGTSLNVSTSTVSTSTEDTGGGE